MREVNQASRIFVCEGFFLMRGFDHCDTSATRAPLDEKYLYNFSTTVCITLWKSAQWDL